MAIRLAGKIANVTGAETVGEGMGNGKAAVLLFAREGATIVAVDLNPEAAQATVAAIEAEGDPVTTTEEDWDRVHASI
jgi:NAD(P)-dependent dehydrogenase (short-subunit alcohol dehydrogenase family)